MDRPRPGGPRGLAVPPRPLALPLEQQRAELAAAERTHGYRIVASRDGITLLHREARR
ncbi:hypothetical protein AB6O49_22525 [Streptomyces sp. SBR177]